MRVLSLALLVLGLFVSGAQAFDGAKKGFVLGGALGFHNISISEDYSYYGNFSTSKTGIASDFLIGYGFTPNFLLMYQNSTSWYIANSKVFYDAVGPIGVRYYLNPTQPGPYFGASAFLASFTNTSADASAGGFGMTLSGGYEFANHYSLNAKWLLTMTKETGFEHNSNAFQVLVEAMAF